MPIFTRDHVVLQGRTETFPYTSNLSARNHLTIRQGLNRTEQGNYVRNQLVAAVEEFGPTEDGEFVYIVFQSPPGFDLDLDKFDGASQNIRLASYHKRYVNGNPEDGYYYEATVFLNKRAISQFLRKIEKYIEKDVEEGKNPPNLSLIANINEIRAATLESFWQEPELPFPEAGQSIWWEIWLSRGIEETSAEIQPMLDNLSNADLQIGKNILSFPEHFVFLIRGTSEQLGTTVLYFDRLSELRKPRDTADFFTDLDLAGQQAWLNDLRQRVDNLTNQSQVSICLLDTGINRGHDLLQDLVPIKNVSAVNAAWTSNDTSDGTGHGTPMAGLALYGDLTDLLGIQDRIQIYHHLESIKLIERGQPHTPELYGAVTIEAVSRAVLMNPQHKRVVCMAITTDAIDHAGKPSSWSSAVDQLLFGSVDERNTNTLMFISSGNVAIDDRINFPLVNDDCSIEDPAQAFNAITVGGYTLKDNLDLVNHPHSTVLARRGGMSSCNTTSVHWFSGWCKKPDIVMESGNHAVNAGNLQSQDKLEVLSISKGGVGRNNFKLFGDTSGATALASKFAAELYVAYPNLWPETIRGLMIHSADWTPAMLNNRQIWQLNTQEQAKLLQRVGYGVPNMQKARYSANNSLSLIAERSLKPYKRDEGGSYIATDEFHLFDLPWPQEVLEDMLDQQVTLKLTLSYYIEPKPGTRNYNIAASYSSHNLRFKVIDRGENPEFFKGRVSKAMKQEGYQAEGTEHWILGDEVRNRGSIHKDLWRCSAADLATRNKIAVYPIGGWWKNSKRLKRYENTIRYSLIVTIEAENVEVDILTPVLNQIAIPV
ncbi:S8 family peptidase [Sediminibacterium sp.]|uniref:S8 family peptidase n=1 Tax=Sediminibacterium sp. TaxID=1917865 RepID=UPI0025F72DCF|nr:S8 family peptidase [Sediminibacterium sp.]